MLAGAAEAPITPFLLASLDATGVLSRRNDDPARAYRPFDRDRAPARGGGSDRGGRVRPRPGGGRHSRDGQPRGAGRRRPARLRPRRPKESRGEGAVNLSGGFWGFASAMLLKPGSKLLRRL